MPVLRLTNEANYNRVVEHLVKWGCGFEVRDGDRIVVSPAQYAALVEHNVIEGAVHATPNGSGTRGKIKPPKKTS
jgi:hypothetical protein